MYEHVNHASNLPPVDCPLVIIVDGKPVEAERTSYIRSRTEEMEYRTSNGKVLVGRFSWTYP